MLAAASLGFLGVDESVLSAVLCPQRIASAWELRFEDLAFDDLDAAVSVSPDLGVFIKFHEYGNNAYALFRFVDGCPVADVIQQNECLYRLDLSRLRPGVIQLPFRKFPDMFDLSWVTKTLVYQIQEHSWSHQSNQLSVQKPFIRTTTYERYTRCAESVLVVGDMVEGQHLASVLRTLDWTWA